jgi:hypothetical protein
MRRPQGPLFTNLSAQRIRGFLRDDNALRVLFCASTAQDGQRNRGEEGSKQAVMLEVKCVDHGKAQELLAIGLGNLVLIYNVKVTINNDVLVTAASGIRSQQPLSGSANSPTADRSETNTTVAAPDATAVLMTTTTTPTATKWTCLLCTFNNYPSTSVCFSCHNAHMAGPVLPLLRPFRAIPVDIKPLIKTVWTCKNCLARKNSPWNESCWKCGRARSTKDIKKSKKRQHQEQLQHHQVDNIK